MPTKYQSQAQLGGENAPWNDTSVWRLGDRKNQDLVDIKIASTDSGKTFNGTVTYFGQGAIAFRANQISPHHYQAESQWGGSNSPWNKGETWIIGDRPEQEITGVNLHSTDNGKNLKGTIQYTGEGPIGFQGLNLR